MNHFKKQMIAMGHRRMPFFALSILLTFTTLSIFSVAQSLAPVELRSASRFAVLSSSLISNIPQSFIIGDVGLSPASGSSITGLSSSEVTGTIYAVDETGPAGSVAAASMLSTAKGDLTTAFNDAAGRIPIPTGEFLNPGAGNIGGLTLRPGLYKFTSEVSITGSDLTLSGSASDVWIFQIGTTFIVGNDIKVVLAGGALAANVFWQVGSSATLGTMSLVKGTIMADQSITINTGARLEGRALTRVAAITLATNTITKPSETTFIQDDISSSGYLFQQTITDRSIEFTVPSSGRTTLSIVNLFGQEVALLFNSQTDAGRYYQVHLNENRLAKGFYFSRLESDGLVNLKR
ncbi:MAG: DUF3494 domain-containing protein, partial [Chitinivibrionales bacterium]|nr:DUF3494 domain-containing protein [Chitinivibrionales bacterium]